MTDKSILKYIDDGAKFYFDFFGDADHMESADNGIYRSIRPKDGEQGITFIYDIRTEHLSDAEAQTKIAEIKSLSLPVWWPLDSKRIGSLLHGKDYEPQPPTGDDEVYMALLPENQPESIQSKASVKQVKTADDFKIWADMANRVFAGGYQDIHPVNHYRWCQNGRLIPYIAYTDGQPAAVAAIMDNSGVASLEFVATLEEYRRMGLARTVCVTALRSAFASGVKIITVRAFYPANLLYQSLGFKVYNR